VASPQEIAEKISFIENNFKIIDKKTNLVPFRLKKCQKHFIENKTHRNVCVKGRQMGFSSIVEADASHDLFTMAYQRQTIITQDTETSEFLFQNVQRFYRNLPWNLNKPDDQMQPKHDWKSGNRMRFPKIDSYIYIDSAKSDSVGIGHTINHVHLSELAKWPDRTARQLWADITQTVPAEGNITAESTPTGRNGVFYEIYQEAKKGINGFKHFFYPWWWDEEYIRDPGIYLTPSKVENLALILGQSTQKFLEEERNLAEYNNLSSAQIAFRRCKIGEIKLLFFQEYPENDIDCWLSNEMSVVNAASLRHYYPCVKEGKVEGDLTVWKDVIGGRNYVIGVDVASGQARDYSVGSVMDVKTMEYVARIRGKIRPDLFGEQLFNLGLRYNNAMIAVERIGHGGVVLKTLLDKGYEKLYYHLDYDDVTSMPSAEAGWPTTKVTKPLMINGVIAAFDSGSIITWSENLLSEASSIVWDKGTDSKIKTVTGGNDDEFIAVSIALQVRETVPIIGSNDNSEIAHSSYSSRSII
jgi:hypothetical protein